MPIRVLLVPFAGCLAFAAASSPSCAALIISNAPTQNVTCTAGDCRPTATGAVLNIDELESALASGDLAIKTRGPGFVEAGDIHLTVPLRWSTPSRLVLQTTGTLLVQKKISVDGSGSLSIYYNGLNAKGAAAGRLAFAENGRVHFRKQVSRLLINGEPYNLVANLAALSEAAATNPTHAYALMDNDDLTGQPAYTSSPVPQAGDVEGLGNTIANVSIAEATSDSSMSLGLFGTAGAITNLRVRHISIVAAAQPGRVVGGLVGSVAAPLSGDRVTGTIRADGLTAGGMVGYLTRGNGNPDQTFYGIAASVADVDVRGKIAGGLVGTVNAATIVTSSAEGTVSSYHDLAGGLAGLIEGGGGALQSFATGVVKMKLNKAGTAAGGLVGALLGTDKYYSTVQYCYATGPVIANKSALGGLIGREVGADSETNYTISSLLGSEPVAGGYVGINEKSITSHGYWDVDKIPKAVGRGSSKGLTGLTGMQLTTSLPEGFLKDIWGQAASVNGGYPYLLKNPPR